MVKDLPEILTPEELASLIHANPQCVRRMCAMGSIPAMKVGRKWAIPRDLVFADIIRKEMECLA